MTLYYTDKPFIRKPELFKLMIRKAEFVAVSTAEVSENEVKGRSVTMT